MKLHSISQHNRIAAVATTQRERKHTIFKWCVFRPMEDKEIKFTIKVAQQNVKIAQ